MTEQIEKLKELEAKLVAEISRVNDHELMDAFLDWQNQRNVCNQEFVDAIEDVARDKFKNGYSYQFTGQREEFNKFIDTIESWDGIDDIGYSDMVIKVNKPLHEVPQETGFFLLKPSGKFKLITE